MKDEKFTKYAELIVSMSTDYLMEKIDKGTFIANLEMIVKQLRDEKIEMSIIPANSSMAEFLGIPHILSTKN